MNVTQAYATVQARLTQSAPPTQAAATKPPASPTLPTPAETASPLPSATTPPPPLPSATLTQACDQAAPGNPIDITIPDDTHLVPGQAFTKIWRLQNAGACIWTTDYTVNLFSGDAMSAPTQIRLSGNVSPGQTVDISIDMAAPSAPGTHQGNWKLQNASGAWFGIGPSGNSPFWVRVVVAADATTTLTAIPTLTVTVTPTVTPTPSETPPAPSTRFHGQVNLSLSDQVDLDNGQINTGAGDDLKYERGGVGHHELVTLNGAYLGVYGGNPPSLNGCQSIHIGSSNLVVEEVGFDYVCYRTANGLFGWMKISSLDPDTGALSVEILAWSTP